MEDKKEIALEGFVKYEESLYSSEIFLNIDEIALLSTDSVRRLNPVIPSSEKLYLVRLRSGSEFLISEQARADLAERLERLHNADAKI
jgi:hypothetical protein